MPRHTSPVRRLGALLAVLTLARSRPRYGATRRTRTTPGLCTTSPTSIGIGRRMCVILSRAPVGCVRASPWPHSGGFCADDRLLEEQHVPIPRIQEARRVARRQGGKAVGRKHQAASADGRARAEARHRSDALPAGELQDRSSLLCIRTHALARTHAAREHGVHPRARICKPIRAATACACGSD